MGQLQEGTVSSPAAAEGEEARRQSQKRILDRLAEGSPFKYLLGQTRRDETGITPQQAQEQYRLACELLQRIESGTELPDLDSLFGDSRYGFLSEPYLNLGVTGWGALQALFDYKRRFGEN